MEQYMAVKIGLLLLAFSIFANPVANAAEYIVDRASPYANDTNPGTYQLPLKSIQVAVNRAESGDTITVMTGAYNERIKTIRAGIINYPIALKASKDVSVQGFSLFHDYVNITGFNLFSNAPIAYDALIYIQGKNDRVSACRFHDAAAYAIAFGSRSAHCIIEDNTIERMKMHNISVQGVGHLITGNIIRDTAYDGLRVFGNGHVISRNRFSHLDTLQLTHTDIVQTFGDNGYPSYNILFEDNIAIDCKCQIGMISEDGSNIHDWTFRNNIYVNVAQPVNIYADNVAWYNNLFYNCNYLNTGNAILYRYRSDSINCGDYGKVINNIFVGCGGTRDTQTGWYSAASEVVGLYADYNFVTTMNFHPKEGFSEQHGINGGNPGFADPEHYDFRLIDRRARVIDVGSNITSILPTAIFPNHSFDEDISGQPCPVGMGYDIGPYEYQPQAQAQKVWEQYK